MWEIGEECGSDKDLCCHPHPPCVRRRGREEWGGGGGWRVPPLGRSDDREQREEEEEEEEGGAEHRNGCRRQLSGQRKVWSDTACNEIK